MPSTFHCPNPVCTQVFDAEAVKGASRLVCPRCGTKFDFRPRGAAPAKPSTVPPKTAPPKPASGPLKAAAPAAPSPRRSALARPTSAPAPTKPAAVQPNPAPVTPKIAAPIIPMAAPVFAEEVAQSSLSFDSEPEVVLKKPRRRGGLPGWLAAAILLVLVFGGASLLVVGAIRNAPTWFAPPGSSDLAPEQAAAFVQQGNFSIVPPTKPWQQDTALQAAMKVDLAYRRSGPNSVMALAFKDYKKRLPRDAELIDAELIDAALSKLRSYLGSVEYEVQPKSEETKLVGQTAIQLDFQVEDPEHVQITGQCLTTASRGIGYWLFTWGPVDDQDKLTNEWASFRQNFKLGDQREGWTEAPRETIPIKGAKLPYKLEYAKGLWETQSTDGYDKRADMVLLGYDPKDKDARRGAQAALVQILVLDKAPDLEAAAKEARDYLLEMEKEKQEGAGDKYNFPDATVEVANGKSLANADGVANVGGFRAHLFKLEVKKSPEQRKYVAMAVVNMEEEGVLAVVCECDWSRRDYWDQEFTPLLDKLKPARGK
jgi:hypothetical protein